jgi:hypothetical protein
LVRYFIASPTGKLNKKLNVKNYFFSFCFSISSFQRMRQTNSYLLYKESFLHFSIEIAKTNDCWPTVIFIAVGQQLFFFFFKCRRKELVDFKILYYASPFSQI